MLPLTFVGAALLGCPSAVEPGDPTPAPVEPPAECAALWDDASVQDRWSSLASLTDPVWAGWSPADATIVWAEEVDGGWCHALWSGGAVAGYALLEDGPTYGFGAYGYLMPWSNGGFLDDLVVQPASVTDWLAEHGVESAVLLPRESSFDALVQLQLPIHEAFHVAVQGPTWFGEPAVSWPAWMRLDLPRAELEACYQAGDFGAEHGALVQAVEASLAGGDVCGAAQSFIAARAARYAAADGAGLTVGSTDPLGCADAEAVYEGLEGVADAVSWGPLVDAGIASDAEWLSRLGATNAGADPFYQLGSGQLFALDRAGADATAIVSAFIAGTSANAGVHALFVAEIDALCSR